MARQRTDATLAALARRRVDLSSAHFGLAFQMVEAGGASATSSETCEGESACLASHAKAGGARRRASRLAVAVPKRQLKRAVDRNALKRVAREAWRLAPWGERARPQVLMLKLRRAEAEWKTAGRSALKKAWRDEIDQLFSRLRRRLDAQQVQDDAARAVNSAVTQSQSSKSVSPEPRDA